MERHFWGKNFGKLINLGTRGLKGVWSENGSNKKYKLIVLPKS